MQGSGYGRSFKNERELMDAARDGNEQEVFRILHEHPEVDVNHFEFYRSPALHLAAEMGHHKAVSLLMHHPNIDVNHQNARGLTALYLACRKGRESCARILIEDLRVDLNKTNEYGYPPFNVAALRGHTEIVKAGIASGKPIDFEEENKSNRSLVSILRDREFEHHEAYREIVEILERFYADPHKTRRDIQIELGIVDKHAAKLYAVLMFLCDGLVKIQGQCANTNASRFFAMGSRLPLELQMVLCRRAAESSKDGISSEVAEQEFRAMAREWANV